MILTTQQLCPSRLLIFTGHYGTGKTECAVNLALSLAAEGEKTVLADLDIVNPYFRSRERKDQLTAAGVRVITSSQACSDADIPAIPAEVNVLFEDRSCRGVMDIGGDPAGARVLARFRPRLLGEDHCLIFVSNANRPEVRTPETALAYLRSIEAVTGLTCGGILNNTHLCGETTTEDVLRGAALAEALSRETGIPVLGHTAEERLLPELKGLALWPVTIHMKKPWETAPGAVRERSIGNDRKSDL